MGQITAAFIESALRRGVVVQSNKKTATDKKVAYAATVEMANLGFFVKPDELEGMSPDALKQMIALARKVIGADRDMVPVYPGFPKQVEELDTLTLLVEQILHYWTWGAFLPNYPTIVREGLPLEDMVRGARELKVLPAVDAARDLTKTLTSAPVALSEDDRNLLEACVKMQHPTLAEVTQVAQASRNGENLQTFVRAVYSTCNYSVEELVAAVAPACDNTDQLLRLLLAVAAAPAAAKWEKNFTLAVDNLSDRNARAVRMQKLSRPTRRLVTERVGDLSKNFKADSLVGRQDLWRTVMRAVHPYDFKLSDEQKRAADIIHSNVEYRTLNSLVEEAMEKKDAATVVELLAVHQPGNLLRRVVAILRLVKTKAEAQKLAAAVKNVGAGSTLTTLISAYNGVISANDEHTRVTRVAGLNNTMVQRENVTKVKEAHVAMVADAMKDAMKKVLEKKPAPVGAVAVKSTQAMPLVRRDAATADRVLDRGQEMDLVGEGDTLRVFGHWNNNQSRSGYMDIGVVILDENFEHLAVSTWDTWSREREWSTYSGDKHVYPGDSAAEYIDVKLSKLRKRYPAAKWAVMTVQSWSGFPMADVDFIAGAMLRSDGRKGEVFDARTVTTAFKPTTEALQSIPYAVNLETGRMVWVDSSNGSTQQGVSSSRDETIGSIVYDELERERLTMGELAELWAEAHGAATEDKAVDRDQLMGLLS